MSHWALVLHGGAYSRPEGDSKQQEPFLRELIPLIAQKLETGVTALEAVIETVMAMEDSGNFNAGKGATANREGDVELDAAVMEGHTLRAGAVAAIRNFRNPILCARTVMEQTKHVLFAGQQAETFLRQQNMEEVKSDYYLNTGRKAEHGTIGAVALDKHGHLAVATSTGGIFGKLPGRVGDSPLIGAGTYADGHVAVSCTGLGEYFIRTTAAAHVAMQVRYGKKSLKDAAETAMSDLSALGGKGGLIALDKQGNIAMPYSTPGMVRGWAKPGDMEVYT